jgi:soluble cytochrome b562
MDSFDDLPPELAETDELLSANRPVADRHTLDRVMSRAQRARSRRLPAFLSSSASTPGHRRKLAVAAATIATIAGSTGIAAAVAGVNPLNVASPSGGSTTQVQLNAASTQYCSPSQLLALQQQLAKLQKQLEQELKKKKPDQALIKQLQQQIQQLLVQIKQCLNTLQP